MEKESSMLMKFDVDGSFMIIDSKFLNKEDS